jgi:transcriptional regulator with XRE-family HTH domain
MNERFRDWFRSKLDGTNLDVADAAREIGVSQSMISNWRNGKTAPARKSMRKLATWSGCTVADIDNLLADEDARRRGYDVPGLGPTGHPDEVDVQAELRALRADLAPFLARLNALLTSLDGSSP